jgi:hypothetical protein
VASSEAARFDSEAVESIKLKPAEAVRPAYNVALGYLRGFLVVLVLAHHLALAYIDVTLPHSKSLGTPPYLWRAFPVTDHVHSTAFVLFTGFNDDFFMSLMFFVSGLFTWSSLGRKAKRRSFTIGCGGLAFHLSSPPRSWRRSPTPLFSVARRARRCRLHPRMVVDG